MARRSEKNFNISLAESLSLKERDNGRSDPEGVFPRVEYEEASSVNNVAQAQDVDVSGLADGALLQYRASDQKFVARNQLDTTTGSLVFNGGNF